MDKISFYLGIDVGTTGTKAALFSQNGQLVGHSYCEYPKYTPDIGCSEQDAEDWWQALVKTVRHLCPDKQTAERVRAISMSTQGGTIVPVDREGKALRKAIVWDDIRCGEEKEEYLRSMGSADEVYQKTGWELGCGLPLLTIRWLKKHEPEVFSKTHRFLSVHDYLSMRLTGKPMVDLSNAGINQLADIRRKIYDPKLLEFAGISEDQLPQLISSGEKIGHLTAEAADALGLTEDCVLVAGAHDQYAVAVGAGANEPGSILVGSGTCWVVTSIGDRPGFDTGLAQSIAAVPGLWGSLLSLSSGGVCLEWLRDLTKGHSYEVINRETAVRRAAEDELFFLPFAGRSKQGFRFRRGAFVGMDLSHDTFHLAKAVMEGVVFQTLWMMEDFPVKPSEMGLILAGGASKSSVWSQILADASGMSVRVPEYADLACVGAAILAAVGCGDYGSAKEAYAAMSVGQRLVAPNPEMTDCYQEKQKIYRSICSKLHDDYGMI